MPTMPGIHHVTAICGDPQQNVDFYAGLLGLRLVKRTVNFDSPDTYHLYYGDAHGNPGTIMTFFPWPGAVPGRLGAGQTSATAFAVPRGAAAYWRERLTAAGVAVEGPARRFGDEVLRFADPDGLPLELVAAAEAAAASDWTGPVPAKHAIVGFHGVTLLEADAGLTGRFLTDVLRFAEVGREGDRVRYRIGDGAVATLVDVVPSPSPARGRVAVGSVHHVAWRARDDAQQAAWSARVSAAGTAVTPVQDRRYFRSIYFREPGGVLFEIATDAPGFATDEAPEHLGEALKLPPWLEPLRSRVEAALPPLRQPAGVRAP